TCVSPVPQLVRLHYRLVRPVTALTDCKAARGTKTTRLRRRIYAAAIRALKGGARTVKGDEPASKSRCDSGHTARAMTSAADVQPMTILLTTPRADAANSATSSKSPSA